MEARGKARPERRYRLAWLACPRFDLPGTLAGRPVAAVRVDPSAPDAVTRHELCEALRPVLAPMPSRVVAFVGAADGELDNDMLLAMRVILRAKTYAEYAGHRSTWEDGVVPAWDHVCVAADVQRVVRTGRVAVELYHSVVVAPPFDAAATREFSAILDRADFSGERHLVPDGKGEAERLAMTMHGGWRVVGSRRRSSEPVPLRGGRS